MPNVNDNTNNVDSTNCRKHSREDNMVYASDSDEDHTRKRRKQIDNALVVYDSGSDTDMDEDADEDEDDVQTVNNTVYTTDDDVPLSAFQKMEKYIPVGDYKKIHEIFKHIYPFILKYERTHLNDVVRQKMKPPYAQLGHDYYFKLWKKQNKLSNDEINQLKANSRSWNSSIRNHKHKPPITAETCKVCNRVAYIHRTPTNHRIRFTFAENLRKAKLIEQANPDKLLIRTQQKDRAVCSWLYNMVQKRDKLPIDKLIPLQQLRTWAHYAMRCQGQTCLRLATCPTCVRLYNAQYE